MRIAVICAFNPGNAGMYTVDMAAEDFFSTSKASWGFYCPQDGSRRKVWRFGSLLFHEFRDPAEFSEFDRIVYWGDFQNNPVYGREEFINREIKLGYASGIQESFNNYKRINLLDGVCGPSKRAVSVSNNFQSLPLDSGIDDGTVAACLERNFRAIFPRDPVSLERLRASYPQAAGGNIQQGIDAAFLLGSRPPRALWRRGPFFTWHFRRSKLAEPERILQAISGRTGLRPVHLEKWFRLGLRGVPFKIAKMRAEIRSSRLVVTDVYHVAVNALALGTPVLCVAREATHQLGTLGEYKKHTLFQMFQLSDWLHIIREGELSFEDTDAIAGRAVQILADKDPAERTKSVRRAASDYRELLRGAILGETTATG